MSISATISEVVQDPLASRFSAVFRRTLNSCGFQENQNRRSERIKQVLSAPRLRLPLSAVGAARHGFLSRGNAGPAKGTADAVVNFQSRRRWHSSPMALAMPPIAVPKPPCVTGSKPRYLLQNSCDTGGTKPLFLRFRAVTAPC